MLRWHSRAPPLSFQKCILGWQLLCTLEVEMVAPCMLHCCFCRASVRRNLVTTVLYTMQRTNGLLPRGCSRRCCKRRASAPPVGSVQVSGPFLPTLCTWKCTQRSWVIRSCIHNCRSAAGFLIGKPKGGGFSLLGLAATCTSSGSILCKRTVGANLCLSSGSTRRYHNHWAAEYFRRCGPGLGWLWYRANLSWVFHTWMFLWKLMCCN